MRPTFPRSHSQCRLLAVIRRLVARGATIGESVSMRRIGGRTRDLERPCRLDPLAARQIFTAALARSARREGGKCARRCQWTRSTESPSVRGGQSRDSDVEESGLDTDLPADANVQPPQDLRTIRDRKMQDSN